MSLLDAIATDSQPVAARGDPRAAGPKPDKGVEDLARLHGQEELALSQGFALQPPVYTLGTRINEVGRKNLRILQTEEQNLPRANVALSSLRATVEAEDRRGDEVDLSTLEMDADGALHRRGASRGRLWPTETALNHLLSMTYPKPAGAGPYLTTVAPAWRAEEWARIQRQANDRPVTLYTRMTDQSLSGNGIADRELYAVASKRYAQYTAASAAGDLLQALGMDAERIGCAVEYEGPSRTTIHLRTVTDLQADRACAGEVFEAGLRLTLSDTKTGGIRVSSELLRNLCLNLIIIGTAEQSNSIRHIGDVVGKVQALLLEDWTGKVQPWLDLWSSGREHDLSFYGVDAVSVLRSLTGVDWDRALLKDKKAKDPWTTNGIEVLPLSAPGMEGPQLLEELLRCYSLEPEPTVTGVVNAVTRLSHEVSSVDPQAWTETTSNVATTLLEGGGSLLASVVAATKALRTN